MGLMGLKRFAVKFGTGYFGERVDQMHTVAKTKADLKKEKDKTLAKISANKLMKIDEINLELEQKELERSQEQRLLEAMYKGTMNPILFNYFKDNKYFYNDDKWKSFSDEFKKNAGGSELWFQTKVVGDPSERTWEDHMVEQIQNTFDSEQTKESSDLPPATKNMMYDVSGDQPFSLFDSRSINPVAFQEYQTARHEITLKKQKIDIGEVDVAIATTTKADKIELFGIDLSKAKLSVEEMQIVNRIAAATETNSIALVQGAKLIQDQKLKMVTHDADNQDVIFKLDTGLQKQQTELNKLAIEAATYDVKTQPTKDLIDNQLKQADILTKQINNASLRQKNTLTIKQLQTNIAQVRQNIDFEDKTEFLNLQKLEAQVNNLNLETKLNEIMLETEPAIRAERLQGLELDNIKKTIDNQTFGEHEQEILNNIRLRNDTLEQTIGNYDAETQLNFDEQKLRIEKLQKDIDEAPKVTLIPQAAITKGIESGLGEALGAPSQKTGSGVFETTSWQFELMESPWIMTEKNNVIREGNQKVYDYEDLIKTDPAYRGIDPKQINFGNISHRILGEKLTARYASDQASIKNIIFADYERRKVRLTWNERTLLKDIIEKIVREKDYNATDDLAKFGISKAVYKQFFTLKDGTQRTSSYYNAAMINTIDNYKDGKYAEKNDIPPLKE